MISTKDLSGPDDELYVMGMTPHDVQGDCVLSFFPRGCGVQEFSLQVHHSARPLIYWDRIRTGGGGVGAKS